MSIRMIYLSIAWIYILKDGFNSLGTRFHDIPHTITAVVNASNDIPRKNMLFIYPQSNLIYLTAKEINN